MEPSKTSLTDGEKEQVKLSAAYLNGIAIGLLLVGGISIPVSILQNDQGVLGVVTAIAFSLTCFGINPYVHPTARRELRELDRWRSSFCTFWRQVRFPWRFSS